MLGCHLDIKSLQVKMIILVNKAHLTSQPSKLCDQWLGLVKLKRPAWQLIFTGPCSRVTKVATGDDHCGLVDLHKVRVRVKTQAAKSIQPSKLIKAYNQTRSNMVWNMVKPVHLDCTVVPKRGAERESLDTGISAHWKKFRCVRREKPSSQKQVLS